METKTSARQSSSTGRVEKAKILRLGEIKESLLQRIPTQIEEFDRVLGGGIVPGSVILLAGDPGIGKSTLLLQTASNVAKKEAPVFYVSGEESPEQIKIRARRLGLKNENILFLNETNVEEIINHISQESKAGLIIVDSIQTMWTEDFEGTAGSIGQVRETAARLTHFAKKNSLPLFLVGHVTKEGAVAGPMVLSHLVDAVLFFEGERYQALRILRGVKNRFGPADEMGNFSMEDTGLMPVANPSLFFLGERKEGLPGSVITCLLEGSRPLLIEVQALVVATQLPVPRRVAAGIDWNRLSLLVAVLSRRAGLPLSNFDIFINIVGGLKVSEPAADLAICLAIASAWMDKAIDSKVCALGEVGLLGEIRMVSQLDKRVKEAKRLGFTKVITPKEASSLREVIKRL